MKGIPNTKPNWTAGKYSVWVNDTIVGYFRQFQSAWTWRNYIRAQEPSARIVIAENGQAINVSTPAEKQ